MPVKEKNIVLKDMISTDDLSRSFRSSEIRSKLGADDMISSADLNRNSNPSKKK